jgi:hypothetical protein
MALSAACAATKDDSPQRHGDHGGKTGADSESPMNTDKNDSDVLLIGVHRRSSVV